MSSYQHCLHDPLPLKQQRTMLPHFLILLYHLHKAGVPQTVHCQLNVPAQFLNFTVNAVIFLLCYKSLKITVSNASAY